MHRLCRNRGRRIRPSDKDLVFRTVFFLLFAVFAVAFVLLNIRTDWRSPSVDYLLFSAAMGVKVCTVTAWLLYRRFPDKLNEMRHRQKLARMVLENQWYEQSDTKQSEGFFKDLPASSKPKIARFPRMYYRMENGLLHITAEITLGKFQEPLLHLENKLESGLYCELVSRELLDQVGGINKEYDGAQDYDFILRCKEIADNLIHIPKVLYHWRVHEQSTAAGAGSKDYAIDAGKCAIESHLQRMGENGKVVVTPYFGFYRIEYGINTENKTEDYVLFADQSLKPLNADWKQILYADCSRKKIGVVGGKIYDRHHRIYEAAFFEKGDWTGAACDENVFSGLREGYGGYMHRANIQMDCDRVSEKCMLVKKEVLEQIEDYEQQIRTPEFSYIVCQKAKEMGYRIMYEPEVKMIFKS